MQQYFQAYRDMLSLRGLTEHTVKSYCTYIRAYFEYLQTVLCKQPQEVSWQELRSFVLYLKRQRGLSDRSINHCISQLRFFTLYVLHQPWDSYQLPSRKFDTFLPYVPSQSEVRFFIDSISDLKVKAMTCLLYSAGLRIGEVCHLRYEDVQRKSMRIHITHGKNRSDRFAILSQHALEILTQYWLSFGKPKGWLFPKQHCQDKPIDTFFLSRHLTAHEAALGWEHRITCHTFRHAFGTHLYQNGADLLTIKALLGHKALKSTLIYIQIAQNGLHSVKSPFDLEVPHA